MVLFYSAVVALTKQVVTADASNLYGFEVQNNNNADVVYLQFYTGADVLVTSFKVPAGANYGKDAQSFPMAFSPNGFKVSVTSDRAGTIAPATPATVNVWQWDKGN